jgi:two-component system OmpR family response regulator
MGQLGLLHVEDDPEIVRAVQDFLTGHGHLVTSVESGAAALAALAKGQFDVLILDRMLPDMSGIDLLRAVRSEGHRAPVLMLSALGRSIDRAEGLDAGVDDYLAKPYDPTELLARIRALHRRATEPDRGALISLGSLQCHPKARTVYIDGEYVALSPKEYRLLRYFLDHAGEVVTRTMLLKDIWNLDFDPQTNVVDVSVSRLRRKLEGGGKAAGPTILTAWGSGYQLVAN